MGKELPTVVQLYAVADTALAGFARVSAQPGERVSLRVPLDLGRLCTRDPVTRSWSRVPAH